MLLKKKKKERKKRKLYNDAIVTRKAFINIKLCFFFSCIIISNFHLKFSETSHEKQKKKWKRYKINDKKILQKLYIFKTVKKKQIKLSLNIL